MGLVEALGLGAALTAVGRAGGALAAVVGLEGVGAGRLTGALGAAWRATGCFGAEGAAGLVAWLAAAGLVGAGTGVAGAGLAGADATGLAGDFGAAAAGASAFFTERMALPAGAFAGGAG